MISHRAGCQNNNSNGSVLDVFLVAIQTDVFLEEFNICGFECNNVDVFDLDNKIDDIPFESKICEKTVSMYNTVSIDHPTPNSIVIYRLDKNKNGSVVIYFLRPYSGASVILTYGTNNGIKLLNTRIGTF